MTIWLLALFVFFVFGRIFPYLQNTVPLGYDPGLYLYLFKKYPPLPDWIVSGYPPGLPVLGKIISIFIAPEKFLIPLIIFFSILLFFSVYLLAKKLWDKRVALWTVFIFTCSALQFRTYWYYYLKNIAALSFLVFGFWFLVLNSYLAIPFAILTAYFHRPSFALLFVALLVGVIFEKKKRRFYGLVLGSTIAAASIYYLPNFDKIVLPLIRPIFKTWMAKASGTFYHPLQALALSLPYLPFALYGLKKQGLKNWLITAPFLVSLLIVVFRLFFFQRFIIFLDLFLIFFAGAGLANFSPPRWGRFLTGVYIGFLMIFISVFIYQNSQPLTTAQELAEIKMLKQTEKDAYVLVTSLEYTPWIYGWSSRKPIAPGFGEHDIYWTIPEWHQFWESGNREIEHQLLLKLPKPLYIFVGDYQPIMKFDLSGDCFQRINWRTYKFICEQ